MKSASLDRLIARWGAIITLTLFIPLAFYVTFISINSAERSIAGRGEALAEALAREVAEPMLTGDGIAISRILNRAAEASDDVFYVCLEDADGRVVAHTFRDGLPSDIAFLIGFYRPGETQRFRLPQGAGINSAGDVMDGMLGRIHLGISRDDAVTARNRSIIFLGATLAVALGLVSICSRLISRRVSLPLRELENAVARFPHDDVDTQEFRVRGTEEVVSLGHRISDMALKMRQLEAEREATMERMVNAERLAAIGEMASGLVHEVRNPLDGMRECVEFLENDSEISERAQKFYPMIREGLERINRIMQDMLSFVRLDDSGKTRLVSMAEVFDSLALMVEKHLEERKVKLEWKRPQGCRCLCNSDAVVQAALNLILNAAEAAEGTELATVKVEAGCDSKKVYLTVEDSGPGVPHELKDKIFDPFVTTKPAGKGTGLGLSVSRQLIRANGGDITLAPTTGNLGGARFIIELPIYCETGERDGSKGQNTAG